ncbi:MAG: DUF2125 domain-containing protein [Caulobacter sp.]|nr:DUF2125 domain-containing protein [Caulobacter sp.]
MTLPDPASGRKRRGPGIAFPFILLLIVIAAWSLGWMWLRGEAVRRMDQTAADLATKGYRLEWGKRSVGGYPFRLDIDLNDVRLAEPSGWALTAPSLKGEAYAYAVDHWVVVAPAGVTFTRPDGGAVIVGGKALRATLSDFDKRPPRIAIEGADLTFSPEAGASPYFLSAARQLNVRLIPGPNDLGGVLLHVGGARMALQGLAARATEGGLVDFDLNLTLTRTSAFNGSDWASAARAWGQGGGEIEVRQAAVTGGAARLEARAGTLRPGPDGRLVGQLDATLGDITGSGQSLHGAVRLQDGKARLGPLVIGPSPKLY